MDHPKASISSMELTFDDDVLQSVVDEATEAAERAFYEVIRRHYPIDAEDSPDALKE